MAQMKTMYELLHDSDNIIIYYGENVMSLACISGLQVICTCHLQDIVLKINLPQWFSQVCEEFRMRTETRDVI